MSNNSTAYLMNPLHLLFCTSVHGVLYPHGLLPLALELPPEPQASSAAGFGYIPGLGDPVLMANGLKQTWRGEKLLFQCTAQQAGRHWHLPSRTWEVFLIDDLTSPYCLLRDKEAGAQRGSTAYPGHTALWPALGMLVAALLFMVTSCFSFYLPSSFVPLFYFP